VTLEEVKELAPDRLFRPVLTTPKHSLEFRRLAPRDRHSARIQFRPAIQQPAVASFMFEGCCTLDALSSAIEAAFQRRSTHVGYIVKPSDG
jgi:hypothetical protein